MKYKVKRIASNYWRPGTKYFDVIIHSISPIVKDKDIVIVSEKALSVAKGLLVDETLLKPGLMAKIISHFWMRYVWGYILAKVCHLKPITIKRLRSYPVKEGSTHKQLALTYTGLLQALRHGSEGGIDVSNLPYSYACLPLKNPQLEAEEVRRRIIEATGRRVAVMIADTDMTYTWRSLHFTPRSMAVKGVITAGGVLLYVVCRMLKMKPRATPLAVAGASLNLEEALELAELAHHARMSGAGKTAWDMAERFGVPLTCVTWEMLNKVKHYPIVIARRVSKH